MGTAAGGAAGAGAGAASEGVAPVSPATVAAAPAATAPAVHEFRMDSASPGGSGCVCQVLRLQHTVYLWLGPATGPQPLGNLVASFQSRLSAVPSTAGLLGPTTDAEALFTARLLRAHPAFLFLVSYNLPEAVAPADRSAHEAAVVRELARVLPASAA